MKRPKIEDYSIRKDEKGRFVFSETGERQNKFYTYGGSELTPSRILGKYPSVLFVCKHNVFRSRIAEYYAKKMFFSYMKNNKINVSSGGIFYDPRKQLTKLQKEVIKDLKINHLSEPKPISFDDLCKTEIVVNVTDNVPLSLFKDVSYGEKRIIIWNIPDVFETDPTTKEIKQIIEMVKDNVYHLYNSL